MKRTIACLILALAASVAAAQEPYPSRPVHVVVPYTPGTGADILARVLGPKLAERWKAAVVTDNKPGATGNIGADAVAKSAPDGYTLLLTATSFTTNPALKPAPFDPVKDFAPIALLATGALGVYINPQVPAKNMREFVALELLKLETGMDIIHVPYKGAAGAITDLVGGQVQAMISALQTVAPHVKGGRLRMLAVMSAHRAEAFPDVPTLKEAGLPELEVETWYAMFAPVGTASATVARVNRDVNELLKEAYVREVLAKQGLEPAGGTPEALAARVKRELASWTRVVKAAGIKAD